VYKQRANDNLRQLTVVLSFIREMVDSAADGRRNEDDNILTEWKSDISTSGMPIKKGPRTTEYDKQKGNFKASVYKESYSSVGYLSFFSFSLSPYFFNVLFV